MDCDTVKSDKARSFEAMMMVLNAKTLDGMCRYQYGMLQRLEAKDADGDET